MRAFVLRMAACLALLGVGSAAQAAYVTSSTLNCRSAPRTTASVLSRLSRGEEVSILSRSAGWAYVDPAAGAACWVSSRYVAEEAPVRGAYGSPTYSGTRSSARQSLAGSSTRASGSRARSGTRSTARQSLAGSSTRRRSKASSRGSRARGGSSVGGSCPCSGSNVCVGPRGGRYCITSGGNKRYGV
ncbi:SH3 domain-containing protein [Allosphingosinicella sp.]|uniref:SH3 domain-containing protein n=1 Tax=Allosphingosinicella sp. TaxID=2823234 RepID=UPI003D76108E